MYIRSTDSLELFLQGKEDLSDIRPEVLASWRRCRDTVDPYQEKTKIFTSCDAVADPLVLQAHRLLFAEYQRLILESKAIFMLTDQKGTVMARSGHGATLNLADKYHITPGSNWQEQYGGTNAVGTALQLKHPFFVEGKEHFCFAIQHWGCAAAPFYDPFDGSLLGVVDLTMPYDCFDARFLPLAEIMAKRLETFLLLRGSEARQQLMQHFHEAQKRYPNDAIFVIDHKGRLLAWNHKAETVTRDMLLPNHAMPCLETEKEQIAFDDGCLLIVPQRKKQLANPGMALSGKTIIWTG